MKKITLLFVAASAALTMKSQMLTENFSSDPTTNGWTTLDNSSPAGSLNAMYGTAVSNGWWYPGNGSPFALGSPIDISYDGLPSQFISAGYANIANVNGNQIVAATSATIDTWLITPPVNIQAGSVFQFATTRATNPAFTPSNSRGDHLELRYATGASITNPSGVNAVGDFTNVLVNINPNYATQTTNTIAVVNNYTVSVANYPKQWTVYSVTIAPGVTPTVGQFAFRYYAPNGGAWSRGYWIGIDGVKYAPVCVPPTAVNYTTCAGLTATVNAQGGPASQYYLWDNGSSTSIATATEGYSVTAPASGMSTSYTVTALDNSSVSCGTSFTTVVSITGANNMVVSVSSSTNSICSYDPNNIAYQFYNDITDDMYYASLFADAPATNYTWSAPGAATYSTVPNGVIVKPTSGGIYNYTVTAAAGACTGSNVISLTVLQTPIVNTSASNVCSTGFAVITATSPSNAPATQYLWYFDTGGTSWTTYTTTPTNSNVTLTPATIGLLVTTNGDPNNIGYFVTGNGNNGCANTQNLSMDVIDGPTLSLVATPSVLCRGGDAGSISVDGADTYTWSNVPGVAANASVSIPAGTGGNSLTYTSPTATISSTSASYAKIQVKGENAANGCVATASVQIRLYNCTGIEENTLNAKIVLYPNPALSGKTEIHGLEGKNTITVFNMLGQQISNIISNSETANVDLSNQPSGNYLIKITNDNNQTKTIKVINQN